MTVDAEQTASPSPAPAKVRIWQYVGITVLALFIPVTVTIVAWRNLWPTADDLFEDIFVGKPPQGTIDWQPFNQQILDTHLSLGRTVIVYVMADWDVASKINETKVINTPSVRRLIGQHAIVTLQADMTQPPTTNDIAQLMQSLNQKSIPILAIFPASSPDEPIVLTNQITEQDLLFAIEMAVAPKTE